MNKLMIFLSLGLIFTSSVAEAGYRGGGFRGGGFRSGGFHSYGRPSYTTPKYKPAPVKQYHSSETPKSVPKSNFEKSPSTSSTNSNSSSGGFFSSPWFWLWATSPKSSSARASDNKCKDVPADKLQECLTGKAQ